MKDAHSSLDHLSTRFSAIYFRFFVSEQRIKTSVGSWLCSGGDEETENDKVEVGSEGPSESLGPHGRSSGNERAIAGGAQAFKVWSCAAHSKVKNP